MRTVRNFEARLGALPRGADVIRRRSLPCLALSSSPPSASHALQDVCQTHSHLVSPRRPHDHAVRGATLSMQDATPPANRASRRPRLRASPRLVFCPRSISPPSSGTLDDDLQAPLPPFIMTCRARDRRRSALCPPVSSSRPDDHTSSLTTISHPSLFYTRNRTSSYKSAPFACRHRFFSRTHPHMRLKHGEFKRVFPPS
jgi:hypothetical protein